MKIADFFVQITAKGDIKELREVLEIQKALKNYSKQAIAEAKVKEQQLKKETAQINAQAKQATKRAKEEAKKPKTLKEYLMTQGKVFSQQNKMNGLIAKGVLQTMGLTGAFIATTGAIIGAAVALDKMVMKLTQANQLYTNFQRQTGMSMRGAMDISSAMANLDVSMSPEQIMQNMQNLQSNLTGIEFGMGNIAPYQMAGINPFGLNPENMLDTIRKQMKGFAPRYRTYLLQQMGLDPRLGALIDLSDEDYLKYKQEALELYLSPEDRKTIQKLAPEWNKVNLKFAKMWDKTTLMLMENFQGIVKVLNHLIDVSLRFLEIFDTILKPLLDILTIILKPLYYLLDDIMVWLAGGDSIIGRFLKGEKTPGALGTLFNVDTDAIKEHLKDLLLTSTLPLFKFLPGFANAGMPTWLASKFMPTNSYGDTTNNKNLSMQNNIDIHVGSAEDGYKMVEPIQTAYNGIIAQMA